MVNNVNVSKYDQGTPPSGDGDRKISGGPLYDLTEVLSLASNERSLNLWTKKANEDVQDLEWDISDVSDLIQRFLDTARYRGSEWCTNGKVLNGRKYWIACDSYAFSFIENRDDGQHILRKDFYLKFGITGSGKLLLIASCHP